MCIRDSDSATAMAARQILAQRDGPRIALVWAQGLGYGLDRLVAEQALTVNTAAAGGNASLMSLQPA